MATGLGIIVVVLYLLMILVGIASLVCFVMVVIKMFQHDQTGLGIACIVLAFCTGIGPLIAFIYGWIKVKEWDLKNVMIGWTACFAIQFVLIIGIVVMAASVAASGAVDFQNQMQDFDDLEIMIEPGEMSFEFSPDGSINLNEEGGPATELGVEPDSTPATPE